MLIKASGEPYANLLTKALAETYPDTNDYLCRQAQVLIDGRQRLASAECLALSLALHRIASAAAARYQMLKATRALLDFDDLIAATGALFSGADSDWALYKLDQGLDHILLDEAQDTSADQWSVIEGPLAEFFAGAGAREDGTEDTGPRTCFVVGDEKQSIYSFQGADMALFSEKRISLGKEITARGAPFVDVPLTLSFRSTRAVLETVDAIFADDGAAQGLTSEPGALRHGVMRGEAPGLAELWPLTQPAEDETPDPWDAPLDQTSAQDPARAVAARIAETLRRWLDQGEMLASAGRPISAGDVMILVQRRGKVFTETIRALVAAGVPVAGADRIDVLSDPSVEDLISLARFCLQPSDDLSLAEVLKSPLCGFDEDALFELAHNRSGGLWRALRESSDKRSTAAAGLIEGARKTATGGPYAFLSHVLETGAPSGRKRIYRRLGPVAGEALDEFLAMALQFEQSNPRSLQGFLQWLSERDANIKRQLEGDANAVRVMTVHGSKGLEAPIVFLADAGRGANVSRLGPLLEAGAAQESPGDEPLRQFRSERGLYLVSPNKSDGECPAAARAREAARTDAIEEDRRLLYVAATRARDRLYICGAAPKRRSGQHATWHELAKAGFDRLDEKGRVQTVPAPWAGADADETVWRVETGAPTKLADAPLSRRRSAGS